MKFRENQLTDLCAGCSALSWETADKQHLWGRNLDYNALAEQTCITYVPRDTVYYTCGTSVEQNVVEHAKQKAMYAAVGTGFLLPSTPILYEGINEKGLMGGQLYYREFAHFKPKEEAGTTPVQAPLLVYHALAHCETVEQVVQMVQQDITLVAVPLFGAVPTLHWSFSDRTGEMIIIEPDKDGVHIYRNTIGVMTNSPSYSWHRLNLLNYVGIRALEHDALEIEGDAITPCFSGTGAQGLPGDWTSPSRFVRLAFLKKYGCKGKYEEQGVTSMFHLFQSVAFPLGMIDVHVDHEEINYDAEVIDYDYTIYTSVMCAESLRFYWTSYENQRIQCVDLNQLCHESTPKQFTLHREPDILYHKID